MKKALGIVLGVLLGYGFFCLLVLGTAALYAGVTHHSFDPVQVVLLCLAPVVAIRCGSLYSCAHEEPELLVAAVACVLLLALGGFAGWRWATKGQAVN